MTNSERAAYGERAVPVGNPDHDDSMREDSPLGVETSAQDTVANILHYVKREGGNPEEVLRMARTHYEAEKDGFE